MNNEFERICNEVGWINVAQDRGKWWDVVKIVMNLEGSKNSRNFLTSKGTVSFSRTLLMDLAQGNHSALISGTISASTWSSRGNHTNTCDSPIFTVAVCDNCISPSSS
jgi:hypothetical protein